MKNSSFSLIIKKKLFFLLLLLPFLLFFLFSLYFLAQHRGNKKALQRLEEVHRLADKTRKSRLIKDLFIKSHSPLKERFLPEYTQDFLFLKDEISQLNSYLTLGNFPGKEKIKARIDQLEKANSLLFDEVDVRASPLLKEIEWKSGSPVEADLSDLSQLLKLLDNTDKNSPQPYFLITQFHFKKGLSSLGKEVYLLDLGIIERRFYQR